MFIENMMNVLNGRRNGTGAGYTFGPGPLRFIGEPAVIPNRNHTQSPMWPGGQYGTAQMNLAAPGDAYTLQPPQGQPGLPVPAYPLLDMAVTADPMPADYVFVHQVQDNYDGVPGYTRLTDQDSPGTKAALWPLNTPGLGGIPSFQGYRQVTLDVEFQLRVYVCWRFADGSRYTLAHRDWNTVFLADRDPAIAVPAVGLNRMLMGSGTFSPNAFVIDHNNPVVTPPTFNNSTVVV